MNEEETTARASRQQALRNAVRVTVVILVLLVVLFFAVGVGLTIWNALVG